VVDDVQWMDPSSARALAVAVPRLGNERVAFLAALREGEPSAFDTGSLPSLDLGGLAPHDAVALVGDRMSPRVAEQVVRATEGNPLALLEVPDLLTEGQRSGLEPLPEPLPVGPRIEGALLWRVDVLPTPVWRLLLLASAGGDASIGVLLAAAGALGIEDGALDATRSAGLLTTEPDGRVRFVHPLLRSAVYHRATKTQRQEAHRLLGEVLTDDEDRRAWHLAAAATGRREKVAAGLERVGAAARDRGALEVAAQAFERAAAQSPNQDRRRRRLVSAGEAFFLAGQGDRAVAVFDRALAETENPLIRADIHMKRTLPATFTGSFTTTFLQVTEEAEGLERLDAAKAAELMAIASFPAMAAGRVRTARFWAERSLSLSAGGGPSDFLASITATMAALIEGEQKSALPTLREMAQLLEARGSGPELSGILEWVANGLQWSEDFGTALRLLTGMIDVGRRLGAPGILPFPLTVRSELSFRTGRWASALADATEALTWATEVGLSVMTTYALVVLARIESGLGRDDEARRHANEAIHRARSQGMYSMELWSHAILGFLELSVNRLDDALEHLNSATSFREQEGMRHPGMVFFEGDLIETLARLGLRSEGEEAIERLSADADLTGSVWARAVAARGRGLLAADHGFEEGFTESLTILEDLPMPFERARSELCYGERLRRAGRRADAGSLLGAAQDAFSRLGAARWSERCATELAACGVLDRATPQGRLGQLTPQELQVVLAVAHGATNREAATALFLSPRTVEYHLANAYRKLAVHSRSQLVRAVAESGELER
jgi:DNA-binding CsgD family transcriptional regulator